MIFLRNTWFFIKEVVAEFFAERVLKYGASLAYYTVLSIAPLLMIVLTLSGFFWGEEALKGELYGELRNLVGNDAALQIQSSVQQITLSKGNFITNVISAIVLVIGATGIFGEIQDSLNRIWGLKTKTRKVWWKLFLDRAISFSLILSIGFILIVSLVLNTVILFISSRLSKIFGGTGENLVLTLDNLISFVITTLVFATILKILPDAKIKWRDVLVGSVITSVLFMIGRKIIGYFFLKAHVADAYGAAGGAMVLMLWVYYSAAIFYLGAVITKVYATHFGGKIQPSEYSVWVKTEDIPMQDLTLQSKNQ